MPGVTPASPIRPAALAGWAIAWLPMVLIAIVNGVAREAWLLAPLGEARAQQVSTLSAIALFGVYIWWVMPRLRPHSARQAAALGGLWLAMTLAFEFLFGHFVAGHSWSALLANYNLAAGRLWPLIPLWVAIAPPLVHRLRSPYSGSSSKLA
ncbi:hypothetical protein [Denitromonas ohlonensis]|jgi:hypothetical protein|uniref:Uncharacterized protein n=2 Tax=Denitromonas TaxID=139331 RepID=A0A557RRS2_9RHOO|nr:hypothetical protein [Denitromonas ohlonensis]TVO67870.1 hypothetical protein FHP90_04630 [Denitromonas ohlonensis]TVO78225.1 hypothetical protein FHP89_07030 [Denitromonas ohlonensis]TVT47294.1 MAG: hypothetical protein FHP94_14480 [Denitromonas halophila]TVT71646.1 MAG: hypothetical protein FHP93_09215 [Denitromonas halophila]